MKMKPSLLSNSKGLALPAVVMIGTVIMGSITFMMSNTISEKNVAAAGKNVSTDTIISGVFVYADSLLKERRCINTSTGKVLKPDVCDPDVDWDQGGNLARLLISDSTAATISSLDASIPYPKLTEVEFEMKRGDFASSHPMRVLMEAESTKYDKMKIRYNVLPDNQGIEGYFFIETTVGLYVDGSLKLEGKQKSLYAPLMINNYSLVLNRNVTLTNTASDADDPNDNGRSPNQIYNGSGGKLIFDSPVMVNQNLILPDASTPLANKTFFKARLDLGGTLMTSDGGTVKNFEALKGGIPLSDYPGFTGFRGGIRNIEKDTSLDAMFMKDLADPTAPRFDFTVETECPKYTDRRENCLGIDESKVIFSPYDADHKDNGQYLIALTKENEFQPLQAPSSDRNDYAGGIVTASSPSPATLSITLQNAFTYTYVPIVGEEDFYTGATTPFKQLMTLGDVKTIDMGDPPDPKQFELSKKVRLNGSSGTNTLRIDLRPFMRLKQSVLQDWKDTSDINGSDKPYYTENITECTCSGTPVTCSESSSSSNTNITETTSVIPSDDTQYSNCNNGADGKTNKTYTASINGNIADIVLQERPEAYLDVAFDKETNYRYKMTVNLNFVSGQANIGTAATAHWEWILSDTSEGTEHILLRMIVDPFDFTYSDDGTPPISGSACDTGPYAQPMGSKTVTFRIDPSDPNKVRTQLYEDALFGGTNDDRNWYTLGGDSKDDIGLIPDPGGLSLNEKRSLRAPTATEPPSDFQTNCTAAPAVDFDPVSLDADFRKNAFDSWNFNPVSKQHQYRPESPDDAGYKSLYDKGNEEGAYGNRMIFDDHNHNLFHVYSILDYCVVKPGAEQVMGFVTCRRLKIESRSKPLNMIGTFVVDQIEFANGSLSKDIRWMNIFHPRARSVLVDNKILRDNCTTDPNNPFWKVSGSDAGEDYAKIQDCRPADIMQKADPFRWTSFKPECGPVAGGTLRSCIPKGLYKNFMSFIMNEKFER